MQYNKLVRDRIPDIIKAKGETVVVHTADSTEYWAKLKEKLSEEVAEFQTDESIEELADIFEVIDALIAHKGFAREDILSVQAQKRVARGGFTKRIILEHA